MNRLVFRPKVDNIFEFSFMDDFTTIILAEEEYGIDKQMGKSNLTL